MAFENGPYLIVAAFCELVIEDKSGVLSLIRIVDRLTVSSQGPEAPDDMPPTTLNWSLVLSMKSGKMHGSHPVKIEPELPTGERLDPIIVPAHFEGGNRGINIVSKINMKLEEPGIYWFRVYIDNKFLTQIPIEVIYAKLVMPQAPSQ